MNLIAPAGGNSPKAIFAHDDAGIMTTLPEGPINSNHLGTAAGIEKGRSYCAMLPVALRPTAASGTKDYMGQNKILRPHLKTARDARAVRTRESLRQALLRLLDLKSFEQITILDICQLAEVGYTTFFRHYLTKEALLDDLAAEQMGHFIGLSVSVTDSAEGMRSASIALCTYVDKHRKIWSTLLTGGAAGAMRDEFLRLAKQIAATRKHPGAWPPADVAIIIIVTSTIELLSWWLQERKPLTIEEIAEILVQVIVTPAINGKRSVAQPTRRKRAG
jgi:AcrR family transcriptional regulator